MFSFSFKQVATEANDFPSVNVTRVQSDSNSPSHSSIIVATVSFSPAILSILLIPSSTTWTTCVNNATVSVKCDCTELGTGPRPSMYISSPVATTLVGLDPPKRNPKPPKLKHYKSVEFLSIFRMSSPPAQTQSPPIENFLATVLYISDDRPKTARVFF